MPTGVRRADRGDQEGRIRVQARHRDGRGEFPHRQDHCREGGAVHGGQGGRMPTTMPIATPTAMPTAMPTATPTAMPTIMPTAMPTSARAPVPPTVRSVMTHSVRAVPGVHAATHAATHVATRAPCRSRDAKGRRRVRSRRAGSALAPPLALAGQPRPMAPVSNPPMPAPLPHLDADARS